jgi:hypothetical protein
MNFTAGNQYLADLLRGQTLSDADLNALVLFKIDTWWRRWRKRPFADLHNSEPSA